MPVSDYVIDAIQGPLPAKLDTWHVAGAPPLVVTYAFEVEQSSEFIRTYTDWSPWPEHQKEAVRWALREYESVINVRYMEVAAGPSDPDIAFGRVYAPHRGESWGSLSYGLDAAGQVTHKSWDAGVVYGNHFDLSEPSARFVLLHEIGHAMLMKHPGDYDVTGANTPGPFLPTAEDNRHYTVMSYNRPEIDAEAWQLQLYDVAALQARWGANTSAALGDSIYTFADDPGIFAIWDAGGIDRIDASAATGPADINLAEGAFSQLAGQNRMSIAWGAAIENAAGGASDDRIRGNALDNRLTGGAGADTIEGGTGLNYLRGESGDDLILGGAHFDDAHGNTGDDTVHGGGFDDWVVGGQGNDVLFGDDGGDLCYGQLGSDTIDGGAGGDAVVGGQANDLLNGGAGDDVITGDRGDDTLTGGLGADTFLTSNVTGLDRVTDFSQGQGDTVRLVAGSTYTASQVGADTVIDMGGGARMILVGVTLSTLTSGWIL